MTDQELTALERRLELAATGANIHTAMKTKFYLKGRRDDPKFLALVNLALDRGGEYWKLLAARMRRWF